MSTTDISGQTRLPARLKVRLERSATLSSSLQQLKGYRHCKMSWLQLMQLIWARSKKLNKLFLTEVTK